MYIYIYWLSDQVGLFLLPSWPCLTLLALLLSPKEKRGGRWFFQGMAPRI